MGEWSTTEAQAKAIVALANTGGGYLYRLGEHKAYFIYTHEGRLATDSAGIHSSVRQDTRYALYRREWLDSDNRITPLGLEVATKIKEEMNG